MRVTGISMESNPLDMDATVRLDISCTPDEAQSLLNAYRRQFRHEVTVDFKEPKPKALPVSTANITAPKVVLEGVFEEGSDDE